jgi:LmbE family N-acetylglucosaminyl deacetylase
VTAVDRVVLHVSPHPDDEVIGAPAMLMALRDANWRIVNFACSLGRREDAARRRQELEESCRRARFDLIVEDHLPGISSTDDLERSQHKLSRLLAHALRARRPDIVVSPSPHDGHHGHEVVARAVRDAIEDSRQPIHWAMWGLWSELPLPNLVVPFEAARLREIRHALQAHRGEVDRNDYLALVRARAAMNAILGTERVFGFGAVGQSHRYAELLSDVVYTSDGWQLLSPRLLDSRDVLAGTPVAPVGWWLYRETDRARLRREMSWPSAD